MRLHLEPTIGASHVVGKPSGLGFASHRLLHSAWMGILMFGLVMAPTSLFADSPSLTGTVPRNHLGMQIVGRLHLRPTDGVAGTECILSESAVWLRDGSGYLAAFSCPGAGTGAHSYVAGNARAAAEVGFDALVIGDAAQGAGRGRAWVYFGGVDFDSLPDLILSGVRAGDLFGASVAGVGDVDGDGYGDFAVGAPGASNGAGKVYVYLGGPMASATPVLILSGQAGDLFGTSLTALGEPDASGEVKYAIGAPGASGGQGAVYIFRGGDQLPTSEEARIVGDRVATYGERPRFGAAIAGGADFDRDGRTDFFVGAPGDEGERGRAYAFMGGGTLPTTPTHILSGSERFGHFGAALALDSLFSPSGADLVVAAPGVLVGRGRVLAYSGALGLTADPSIDFLGRSADDWFGGSVAVARVTAGDDYGDLLVGALLADAPHSNGGATYRFAPHLVDVSSADVVALADGRGLTDGMYVSTRPQLILRLPGAAEVDPVTSSVMIDGDAVPPADIRVEPAAGVVTDGGLTLTPALSDGAHLLVARLVSVNGEKRGVIRLHFFAAARLQLIAPRVWPNPSHGATEVGFTLTRPAAYSFEVYDVLGRRVYERQFPAGVPEANRFSWDWSTSRGRLESGVYLYVLGARYGVERVKTVGRIVLLR